MDEQLKRVFEMMGKLDNSFTMLTEDDQLPPQIQNGQQTDIKTGDAKRYDKVSNNYKALGKSSDKINTVPEFSEVFKIWFQKLGYTPQKGNISISKVTMLVKKAMTELGYK